MKKYFILLIITGKLASAQITSPAPYCSSTYTSTSLYPEISKVEVSTLTNTSVHAPSPGYTYYNNLTAPPLIFGTAQTIKVTFKNVDMETALKAWVDYNKNSVFEPNELIIYVPKGSVGTGMAIVKQAVFNVPGSAIPGLTRMRVSLGWHYANWTSGVFLLDSCHTAVTADGSAGETEDYDVAVVFPTGTKETAAQETLNVFPNPASGKIQFYNLNETLRVSVYNAFGKIIFSEQNLDQYNNEINISGLDNGIYFICAYGKNSEHRFYKIIKQD